MHRSRSRTIALPRVPVLVCTVLTLLVTLCLPAIAADPDTCDVQTPGDANSDGTINVMDMTFIIGYICQGGPRPEPAANGDPNGDCVIDTSDIVYLANHIFSQGPPPVSCTCVEPAQGTCQPADTCAGQLPGDANSNGTIELTDMAFLASYVCGGGPRPDPAANGDPNGDCVIDSADITYLSDFLFFGGPLPVTCTCVEPLKGACNLCLTSYTDPCLTACPAGDIPFTVYMREADGTPVPGVSSVWLDFSGCSNAVPCQSEVDWPIVHPNGPSDDSGRIVFYVNAGGCDEGCLINVEAFCGTIASVPFKSVDTDGDLIVKPQDFDVPICNDFNCDGITDISDLALLTAHLTHNCVTDVCDLFGGTIALSPDSGLVPGDTVDITVALTNGTPTTCVVDSVVLLESGFDLGGTLTPFETIPVGTALPPSGMDTLHATYVIPGGGQGCITAHIYTSCCDSFTVAERCVFVVRLACPVDTSFTFTFWIPTPPLYYKPIVSSPLPFGFSVHLNPGEGWILAADSVEATMTIDTIASIGDSASISMLFFTDETFTQLITSRQFQVFFQQQRGDVTEDCKINSTDIIYLVNYVFKGGPEPKPETEAGNVDCKGGVTSADIIYLVNFVFKGGPPPLGRCP